MYVKRFTRRHLGHVIGWLNTRDMNPELANELPEIGFIVFAEAVPVACAFLRQVEGNFALVDSAITNPHAPAVTRDRAMQLVSEACLGQARSMGIKQVIVMTTDSNTRVRAEKLDFIYKKEHVLVKKL